MNLEEFDKLWNTLTKTHGLSVGPIQILLRDAVRSLLGEQAPTVEKLENDLSLKDKIYSELCLILGRGVPIRELLTTTARNVMQELQRLTTLEMQQKRDAEAYTHVEEARQKALSQAEERVRTLEESLKAMTLRVEAAEKDWQAEKAVCKSWTTKYSELIKEFDELKRKSEEPSGVKLRGAIESAKHLENVLAERNTQWEQERLKNTELEAKLEETKELLINERARLDTAVDAAIDSENRACELVADEHNSWVISKAIAERRFKRKEEKEGKANG